MLTTILRATTTAKPQRGRQNANNGNDNHSANDNYNDNNTREEPLSLTTLIISGFTLFPVYPYTSCLSRSAPPPSSMRGINRPAADPFVTAPRIKINLNKKVFFVVHKSVPSLNAPGSTFFSTI